MTNLTKEIAQDVEIPAVALNINLPATENKELVKTEEIVSLCKNIMVDIQSEKDELTETLNNFAEMVFNGGDATGPTKEALVNLYKLRSDLVDKKTKIMEMMMKMHLREGPKTVTAHQHIDMNISDKRKLIQDAEKENK